MWVDRLIIEYEEGRQSLRETNRNYDKKIACIASGREPHELDSEEKWEIEKHKQDKQYVNSMIDEMSFAIDWMKTGRRPGNFRGVDKRSAYQRRILVDMDLLPSLDITPEPRELSEDKKKALRNILIDLSHRERQCYLLHMAQGWSMQEIAEELNIKKPSVQKFIERAKNKVKRKLSCHTNVI